MPYYDPLTGEYVSDPLVDFAGATGQEPASSAFRKGGPALTPPDYVPPILTAPDSGSVGPSSVSTGGGYSEAGFDTGKARDVEGFLEGMTDRASRKYAPEFAARRAAGYRAVEDATRQRQAGEGTQAAAAAEVAFASERAALDQAQVRGDQLRAEAVSVERANKAVAAAKMDWMNQVQKTAALGIDPDKLLKDAGPGGRLGLGLAAFAEGFLGAKGIKINAVESIRKRIDDSIQSQLVDIQQGRETTAQFRALYDAARVGAIDEADARNRMNVMALNAVIDKGRAMVANATGELEQAKGMKLVADLEAAKMETQFKIDEALHEEARRRVEADRTYAVQAGHLALARRSQDWEESVKNPKNGPAGDAPAVIRSPETGETVGLMRGGFTKEEAGKVQESLVGASDLAARWRVLRDKMVASGVRHYSGPLQNFFRGPEGNALKAEYRSLMILKRRIATGAQASAAEDQKIEESIPWPSVFNVTASESAQAMNREVAETLGTADRRIRGFAEFGTDRPLWEAAMKEAEAWGQQAPEKTAEEVQSERVKTPVSESEKSLFTREQGPGAEAEARTLRRSRFEGLRNLESLAMQGRENALADLKIFAEDYSLPEDLRAEARSARDRILAAEARGEVGTGFYESQGERVSLPVVEPR